MSAQQLRLPPFGNVLLAYQKETIRLQFPLYIFVGRTAFKDACESKKVGILCTCLPYGEDFNNYDWPVNDQHVIIYDTGKSSAIGIKKFCYHLQKVSKPRVIFVHSEDLPLQVYNMKELNNGQH
jgi:hypothetical protein